VQVLDIEDIGSSRWSQVEAIESEERGEKTKGREIIRVVASEEGETQQNMSGGPHKLLLQDSQGSRVYGFELFDVDGINLNMNIGTKLVLRDVTVARSTVLLDPKSVAVLGGKIEDMHKRWEEGRKEALKTAARGGGG
jgi:RecQ-mediated genome instability protein 1